MLIRFWMTHGTVYRWEDGTYSNYEKEPVEETYEIRTFEEFKKIPEIVRRTIVQTSN